jgi:hypothetical protein
MSLYLMLISSIFRHVLSIYTNVINLISLDTFDNKKQFFPDGSVTISLRNFVGEGIIKSYLVCSTMQPAHELIIVW